MSDDEAELRLQLAEYLIGAGHLRTDPWRRAVESVPRHEFLRGGYFQRVDIPGRPTAWAPVMPDAPSWREAYAPSVVVGDGLEGWKDSGPYDRIVAYCGTVTVPPSWIEQTRPGGIILATVGGWMYSSELVRLTVKSNGTAVGRFLDGRNSFMLARPQTPPPLGMLPDIDQGDEQTAELGADLLEDWDTRFVAQLAVPGSQRMTLDRDGRTDHVVVDVEAGAWAALRQDGDRWLVRQGGPDNLWDRITDHVTQWRDDGAPGLDRFEIAVTHEAQTITWRP